MKRASFWEQDSFYKPYDLIIIGAGIVGLSSALFYKRQHPDARVLVLDKGAIPEGASTRNAGFACVGSITEHVADMDKETEENIKKRILRRYEGLMLLRETLGDEAIGYENCGGYELFTSNGKFEKARRYIPQFNSWMKALIGENEVYQPQKLNGYDAIYNRIEGALHPGKMMQQLIHFVQKEGVMIRWKSKVEKVAEAGMVHLEGDQKLQAEQVLCACNGFTKRLLPDVELLPARGTVLVTEPWEKMPWKGTFNYDRGYIYFRHVKDRLLLGGGRNIAAEEETRDAFEINKKIESHLINFARKTLQVPESIDFEYRWSGIMGFTPTKTPVVKQLDEHRIVAAGLSGMGIAIGMEVGQTVSRLLHKQL